MNRKPKKSGVGSVFVPHSAGFGCAALLFSLLVGWAAPVSHAQEVFRGDEGSKPYTHLQFQNDPDNFQFAVIGDRTGGHRKGVFPAAVDVLNLLQPEFVMSVGDFIEGYVEDEALLKSMWEEVDGSLQELNMPLFFVMGHHDVNLDPSESVWFERVGASRGYSHFVYRNVLFLLMSTDDPPKKDPGPELEDKYQRVKAGQVSPEEGRAIVEELEAWAGKVNISDGQVEYFKKVLADNPGVRWTFAFMHAPAWAQPDPGNFARIESLLADRPYTIFAGHTHTYNYTERKGRDYITMGMTGGLAPALATPGNMDHVAWITMTEEGPVISNLLLNGILDKTGAVSALQDSLLYRPR
jgi:hypothetical protein